MALSMEHDLPPGWTSRDENSSSGRDGGTWFEHAKLDIGTWDDPRTSHEAGPVPAEWTCGFGWSRSNCEDQELTSFFVNLRTGETTREDPGPPLSEDGSVLGGFRII